MKKILFAIIMASCFMGGCLDLTTETEPEGVITGRVTIGPLCPVEPCNLTDEEVYAAYDARKILVYDRDTLVVLFRISIDHDSTYSASLPAGTYVFDIDRTGVDYSNDVPQKVKLLPSDTAYLDIDIDTGIR